MLLQSNTVVAEEPSKALYCPEKIECSKDKSISSCKAFGKYLEYWGKIYATGTVKKGTYFLLQVDSSYQYPYMPYSYPNVCSYQNVDYLNITLGISPIGSIGTIGANSKILFWEAAPNDTTKWFISGFQAQCTNWPQPISPDECPLELLPLVKIKSNYESSIAKISAYANGILLNDDYWYPGDNQVYWKAINLYQAWDACSDKGLCTIELMGTINEALVDVGSIVVDMDNKMKIVHVHAITGFEISHDEQLNSIEIKPAS